MPGWNSLERLKQDLRFSIRILRKSPGFTAVATITLALGIGTNTAVFSVVNGLLIRSLPFPHAKELVWITNSDGRGGPSAVTSTAFTYRDLRRLNHSFSDMAAYNAFSPYVTYNLTGQGDPERLLGFGVTENFFSVLGVQPALGRAFLPEECLRTGRRAVILANGFWRTRYAGNPQIVGQTLTVNGQPVLVVGVMPATFDFAAIFVPGGRVDLFAPHYIDQESDRDGNEVAIVGRLKSGVTLSGAQAEMTALAQQLAEQRGRSFGAHLTFLEDHVTGGLRRSLFVLAGAVGFVLLIACSNLSNLLLARATARQKELALRLAVGASRFRLIRQMLTESIVLSIAGAILGLPLAFWGTRVLAGLRGTSLPMLGQIAVDQRAILFTLSLSTLTGLTFGILPAIRASRCDVNDALKEGTSGAGGGMHRDWTRGILVVSEVALSFILLGAAGLMMKSLLKLLDTDLGFRPDHVAIVRVDPGPQMESQKKLTQFLDHVVEAVRQLPGVEAAGITDAVPLDRDRSWGAGVVGQTYPRGEYPVAFVRVVGPGYFGTMRIPLLQGRTFNEHDTADSEKVIVINESLARRLFQGQNPLSGLIQVNGKSHVIGVVRDVKHSGLDQDSGMEFYLPYSQGEIESADLIVRTRLKPEILSSALRRTIWAFAPNQPLSDFRTLDDLVETAASPRRFTMLLLSIFAGVALILASVGIYGVISYSVVQRTREMGIRMALGAEARQLRWEVVKQALVLSILGAGLGVAGLAALGRFIASMLFEVAPTDPATFAGVTALLIGVAVMAGYIPARRAASMHPMVALRSE